MARIAGVDLPRNKRIEIALQYIYGIGKTRAKEIVAEAGFDTTMRTDALTDENLAKIRSIIERQFKVEGDLRRELGMTLKRLQGIKCYRGIRHLRGLPVRGQRTSTNARTRKGPRKTVGVQRNPNAKTGIH